METLQHLMRVDYIILAIFLLCAIYKGSQGFYNSLAPLIVTVISLAAAFVLSRLMAPSLADRAFPWAEAQVLTRMDLRGLHSEGLADITSQLSRLLPDTVTQVLELYHISLPPYVEKAMNQIPFAPSEMIAQRAVSAILRPATLSVVRTLLFLGFFLALKLVLSLFKNLLGLAVDLPPVRVLDNLGGAVIGILWCGAVLYLLGCVMSLAVPELFARLWENSRILQAVFS